MMRSTRRAPLITRSIPGGATGSVGADQSHCASGPHNFRQAKVTSVPGVLSRKSLFCTQWRFWLDPCQGIRGMKSSILFAVLFFTNSGGAEVSGWHHTPDTTRRIPTKNSRAMTRKKENSSTSIAAAKRAGDSESMARLNSATGSVVDDAPGERNRVTGTSSKEITKLRKQPVSTAGFNCGNTTRHWVLKNPAPSP
jgi:hypothetical protein